MRVEWMVGDRVWWNSLYFSLMHGICYQFQTRPRGSLVWRGDPDFAASQSGLQLHPRLGAGVCPADADIQEAVLAHVLAGIDVAQIDEDRTRHLLL